MTDIDRRHEAPLDWRHASDPEEDRRSAADPIVEAAADHVVRAVSRAIEGNPGIVARLRAVLDQMAPRTAAMAESSLVRGLTPPPPVHLPSNGEWEMLGTSAPMRKVFEKIRRYADVDAPVLITGESGTGKELAARSIHRRSARSDGPFVAINCAALPPGLVASELFGYEKGSFTGAVGRKLGKLEVARGGTVLLDEIGDLPAEIQGHLLRFLQERTIERVGGKAPIALDVRIIAATNIDLQKAMERGRFREDLFYRLNVLNLHMPPLRDRGDDVVLLARHLLQRFKHELKAGVEDFDVPALVAIAAHPWPGNIRELVACVRRGVVLATKPLVTEADLRITGPDAAVVESAACARAQAKIGRAALQAALTAQKFNVSRSARQLKVSRMTIYRLMRKYGIQIGLT